MANSDPYAIHIVDKDGDGMFMDKVFNLDDMFIEILLRVPPEEIHKQILVSKRFHQVVCSYLFCRAYLARWNQSWHPGFHLIGFFVRNMMKFTGRTLRGRTAPLPIPACRLLPTSRLGDQIQDSGVLKKLGYYIDSTNGILLFGRHPSSYYLWDPSVWRHHQIPHPPPPRVHFKTIWMYLVIPNHRSVGYNYKLIKVDCNSCQAETFYSATNTWSCSQLISFVALLPWALGKVIEGVCFWFTTKGGLAVYNSNDQHCLILRVVTLPTLSPVRRVPSSEVLGEVDGSLLYGSNGCSELALWKLQSFNKGSYCWIPLRRVSLWNLSFSRDRKIQNIQLIGFGTGLKECILSALLSVDGVKVLHMDRNDYCGGESTSLNLKQLLKKFMGNDWAPGYLGDKSSYNVDMMPKFMMGNGKLVRLLIHTGVTKYLSFEAVDGSYVFVKGKVQKVPVTPEEALKSPFMGILEKRLAGNFFSYVQDYDEKDPKTHNGMDLTKLTTKELIA